MSDALKVDCPKCGVKAGDRCRALTSGRTTDTHNGRWDAAYRPPAELTPDRLIRAFLGDTA